MKRCRLCKEDLSPANPSGSNVDKEGCKKRAAQVKAVAAAARKAAAIKLAGSHDSPSPVKKPASVTNYLIKGAQLTQFTDLVAKWVHTEEIPFLKMDSPFLMKPLGLLGATLPGEVLLII